MITSKGILLAFTPFLYIPHVDSFEEAVLEALALRIQPQTTPRVEESGSFYSFGLAQLAWAGDSAGQALAVEFIPLPGTEQFFGLPPVEASYDDAYAVWRMALASPTWSPDPVALELVQVESSAVATGRLALSMPSVYGSAPSQREVTVNEILSGCNLIIENDLPFVIREEPVYLEFTWDLHNPVSSHGGYVRLVTDSGMRLPKVPILARIPAPPITITPAVAFADEQTSTLIEVTAHRSKYVHVTKVSCPPCTTVLGQTLTPKGSQLRLETTELAARRHRCGMIELEITVPWDAEPFHRTIPVSHGSQVHDAQGNEVISGVFAPGERIQLVRRDDGTLGLFCFDRFPCLVGEHRGQFVLGSEFQMPSDGGLVDQVVRFEGASFRIKAQLSFGVFDKFDAWRLNCPE